MLEALVTIQNTAYVVIVFSGAWKTKTDALKYCPCLGLGVVGMSDRLRIVCLILFLTVSEGNVSAPHCFAVGGKGNREDGTRELYLGLKSFRATLT